MSDPGPKPADQIKPAYQVKPVCRIKPDCPRLHVASIESFVSVKLLQYCRRHRPELRSRAVNLFYPTSIFTLEYSEGNMKAADVMVRNVVTVQPDTAVSEAAKLLIDHDISALPVVDAEGRVIGMLSEADLMRREEIGTQKRQRWWLEALTPGAMLAEDYAKSHGKTVEELMSRDVISATEETPLADIASLFEKHSIKRVPIITDGRLVGIVSRANLVQAVAAVSMPPAHPRDKDRRVRLDILARLAEQSWTDFGDRNIIVVDGAAHIWGLVGSPQERKALISLVEGVPGVTAVKDEMIPAY